MIKGHWITMLDCRMADGCQRVATATVPGRWHDYTPHGWYSLDVLMPWFGSVSNLFFGSKP